MTTKTRICLISDTHTSPPNAPHSTLASSTGYRSPLPKADILLHAGDITKVGHRHEHEAMIAMLKDADAELKIVIAGNHDITLDEEYYNRVGKRRHARKLHYTAALSDKDNENDKRGGEADVEDPAAIKALYTHPDVLAAGIHYLDEGLCTFTLRSNNARFTLYASPYSPEFCNWAFAYDRHIDRYNPSPPVSHFRAPNPVPSYPAVDIMLTHGPPLGIFDRTSSGLQVGCENLLKAVRRARPRLHVFGHIHEAYGAGRMDWGSKSMTEIKGDPEEVLEERGVIVDLSEGGKEALRFGEETLFVNASVVTIRYHAVNAPWVVDLDLPVKE